MRMLPIIAALFVVLAPAGEAHAQGKVRINLGTLAPRGSSYHRSMQTMGEKWKDMTGGNVKLVIYPDGTQGGEEDMVRLMRIGTLQAGLLTVVGLSKIEPGCSGLQNLPMMFRTFDEYDYVAQKLQPMLQKRLEEKGFVVLFWGDTGWVHPFTRHPVQTPDDYRKLKLFVWAGGTGQSDIMKKAGYNPVELEPTDIIPGLQTGLIDSVTVPPTYALAGQIDLRAPHMLQLNWAILVGACVMTKDAWDKLTPADRAKLLEVAHETGKEIYAYSRTEAHDAVESMKKRGLQVHPLTSENEAKWREAVDKIYPDIRGGVVPADIYDEVVRLLKEYREGKGASGPGGDQGPK